MKAMIGLMFALSCVFAFAADESPHAKSGGEGIRGAGFTYAKELYPRYMKDPSSAAFDWESVASDHKFDLRDRDTQSLVSVYLVQGVVRSKNSFNAVVPAEWKMIVVERDDSSEMAVAYLGGKLVAKTDVGDRILKTIDRIAEEKRDKELQKAADRVAEAKLQKQQEEARRAGYNLGRKHGAKIGPKVKSLAKSEIDRRARKLAADAGYADETLADSYCDGYADGMAESAK